MFRNRAAHSARAQHRSLTALAGVVLAATATTAAVSGCSVAEHRADAAGHGATPTPTVAPPSVPVAPAPAPAAAPEPTVTVAPLRSRITADVMITATAPLTAAQVGLLRGAAPGVRVLVLDGAQVHLGRGVTTAVGVDPSTFRAWTPSTTAASTPLWLSVARGDLAVAHTVARALGVPLGGTTSIGRHQSTALRVGAYATTGLPGIGAVVDRQLSAGLGLLPRSVAVLSVAGADPVVVAAQLHQRLGAGVTVSPVRVPVGLDGRLTWVPPAIGPITSGFGARIDPLNHRAVGFHYGIDIGAPLNAPIYAAAAGYVIYAGPASGFGNEVVLGHDGGVTTVYGHMRYILVTSGAVAAGQPIALVGAEGEATGPHLHFEVHVNDVPVDPLPWLIAHGVTVLR